jgi:hypothetical protein
MERASKAAVRLPVPVSLRRSLRSIPAADVQAEVPGPRRVPRLPVPASLQARLRTLAGPARVTRPLPAWLRSSRPAVAASFLIVLLAVRVLGEPLAMGRRAVDSAAVRWHGWESGWESHLTATYDETRSSLAQSLTGLSSRATSIQAAVRTLIPESIPSSFRRLR